MWQHGQVAEGKRKWRFGVLRDLQIRCRACATYLEAIRAPHMKHSCRTTEERHFDLLVGGSLQSGDCIRGMLIDACLYLWRYLCLELGEEVSY